MYHLNNKKCCILFSRTKNVQICSKIKKVVLCSTLNPKNVQNYLLSVDGLFRSRFFCMSELVKQISCYNERVVCKKIRVVRDAKRPRKNESKIFLKNEY